MSLSLLLAQVADAAQAAAPPASDAVSWQRRALDDFYSFQFTRMDAQQWQYIAYYFGLRAIFVLILLTIAWTISSWLSSIVRLALTRIRFDQTLTLFFARLVRWGILLMVALACLSYFGVETTSFAAVIGALGLAIGLAFQGTLSNFAAGGMLLVFRPYKIGDVVNVANLTGVVAEIDLFTTAVDTFDNRRIIIPNSSIYGATIENISYHPVRRAEVNVGVAYSADVDQTRSALERAVRSIELVLPEPKPEVALLDLAASSVNWQVRAWCRRESLGDAKQALLRAVKLELDGAGIEIPFPQLDVHIDSPAVEGRPVT
ncbi:MAG: mechanosensitive ion channel [Pirellulales bacterium]|nr:mechanosensitive ion channel [Pirellulales bacterium]